MASGVVGPQGAGDRHRAWGLAGVGAGGCCVANRVRWPAPQGVVTAASERAIQGAGLPGSVGPSPYLSTNHHTRTLAISSANSTKTATRTAMNSSFVSLCAATSFWYSLSSS